MEKGDNKSRLNKVKEIFYQITLDLGFRRDVAKTRVVFNIPPAGFIDQQQRNEWLQKMQKRHSQYVKYLQFVERLRKKYKIPAFASNGIIEYFIEMNEIIPYDNEEYYDLCEADIVQRTSDGNTIIRKRWQYSGRAFATLYISDIASKEDVITYINKNWKEIRSWIQSEPSYTELIKKIKVEGIQSGEWSSAMPKATRVRMAQNKQRDEQVYLMSQWSRELLGTEPKEYKNHAIKRKLEKDFGIKLNEDNIRQIIARQRKLRKKV